MKISTGRISTILVLALAAAWPAREARAETAAELIEQARQFDGAYAAGPEVNRQKALELYDKALVVQPDGPQRLHILFRMAQLQGCIFDPQKGERPNFRKAISLYQRIVESYPLEEPMVLTAMGLISDHYTSLREFDAALTWAKRAIDYDTSKSEQQLADIRRRVESLANTQYTPQERQAIMSERVRIASLGEDLKQMKAGRVAAVDRLALAAQRLDPLRAHGELRATADKYAGTPIGDRAAQRLQEAMDKRPDLWAPRLELPQDPATAWQPAPNAAGILTTQKALNEPPALGIESTTGAEAPEPNTTEEPRGAVPLTKSPRAPPWMLLSACVVTAASLAALGLAGRRIRRKTLSRNTPYET